MPDLALLYDELAETYAGGRYLFNSRPILADFAHNLPIRGQILDVGCGAGIHRRRNLMAKWSLSDAACLTAMIARKWP